MKNKTKNSFECIALLLQGGGALGAYQAGVYQALSEAGVEPDWVAGISIGGINAAIIAGNAPRDRLNRLRQFWEMVTPDHLHFAPPAFKYILTRSEVQQQLWNGMSALQALCFGIRGFFQPRLLTPWLEEEGTPAATSFYDTRPLKEMLEHLIDFDRLNRDEMRLTLGAVNVSSGNFISFDNKEKPITPDHVMASGALPPGLPAVKIDDEYYWDGGLISNTPLQWLLEDRMHLDTLVFQVDLWSANGKFPKNIAEVFTRQKDIHYSSRTRATTDRFKERFQVRHAIADLLGRLPDDLKSLTSARLLKQYADDKLYNIVHLVYHNKPYEGYSKDFEFSRLSMEAHWQAGYTNTINTLRHPQVLQRPPDKEGIAVFDFSRDMTPTKEAAA